MYFRKSEVTNDALYHTRRGFCQSAVPNSFLIKGVGIDNDKHCRELSQRNARKTLEREKKRTTRLEKKSFRDIAVSKPVESEILQVRIVNKTESRKEDNSTEKLTSAKEGKYAEINANSYRSALTKLKSLRERGSPHSSQSGLLRNHREPNFYNLCKTNKDEVQHNTESALCIKHIDAPNQARRNDKMKSSPQYGTGAERLTSEENIEKEPEKETSKQWQGDKSCTKAHTLERMNTAKEGDDQKSVRMYGKRYSLDCTGKMKALNCALSRRSHSVDQTLQDEDYQEINFEYLLKLKAVSRLSRMCDVSVIEAVAKENSVKAENFRLPPVLGSRWTLKDRYVSELSFNPPTPVLREYTRISQARAVDFSDAALGSQVYIM